jgi:hypothetical protein
MGVSTKRGPISTSVISGGPLGCKGSFSIIYPGENVVSNASSLAKQRKSFTDLEVAEPDLGIKEREREDVVDERLGSPSLRRHAKYLYIYHTGEKSTNEHFLLLLAQIPQDEMGGK